MNTSHQDACRPSTPIAQLCLTREEIACLISMHKGRVFQAQMLEDEVLVSEHESRMSDLARLGA